MDKEKLYLKHYRKYHLHYKRYIDYKKIVSAIKYPEWILKKYVLMKDAYGVDNPFTTENLSKLLKSPSTRAIISEMKELGLIEEVGNKQEDNRRKIFKLKKVV